MAVANNKGGVGKTNQTINLATQLVVDHGMRVRVVDLDPQADASAALGFEVEREEDAPSVLDAIEAAFVRQRLVTGTAANTIQTCRWDVDWADKLSFVPARFDLEEATHVAPNRDACLRLRAALEGTDDDVDVVLLDCPPSLGLLAQMGWAAADDILLVGQPTFRSLRGMRRTRAQMLYVREQLLVPDLDYAGFVLNTVREQTLNHIHWSEKIVAEFGSDRHWGSIPLRARLSRLDDELKPVALMEESAEKHALVDLYRPIVQRVHRLAIETITEVGA